MKTSECVAGDAQTVRGRATILVVEEPLVSRFLRSALTNQGYDVVCATAGTARAMLRRDRASIQVLVTNMPLEFAAHPDVPVLYLDAFPDPSIADAFVKLRVLAKPFHPRLLFESVAQLIG